MHRFSRWRALALTVSASLWAVPALGGPCSTLSPANLTQCARQASFERRAGLAAIRAADGRVRAAAPWLPSNPALEVSGAQRRASGQTDVNWSASLGVELEVAGQRGARQRAAVADREAQQSELGAIERANAVEAYRLYFEVLAAHEQRGVLEKLEAAATGVWEAAHAAAERGAAAGIEADVAEVGRISIERRKLQAERDERAARIALAHLVGLGAGERLVVVGPLEPLPAAAKLRDVVVPPDPPEVVALVAEQRAAKARGSALRRSRVPNPTVSVFVQRDGFNEQVLGVGLALPLTLPEPIGRTSSGAVAESEALAERAAWLAQSRRRAARSELGQAQVGYETTLEAAQAFGAERVARAELMSASLAAEVRAGRVPVRDAILFQGPLLELVLGVVEAKKALCLASLELVRAAGVPLDGGRP
jgi:cobalt-zinc-cadmium efflux system outer membrane protein